MLEQLLETGARRRKSAWGGIVSITVHSAIIGVAIVATATARPAPELEHEAIARIRLDPRPGRDATARHGRGAVPATDPQPATPALPTVPTVDVPLAIIPSLPDPGASLVGGASILSAIGAPAPNGASAAPSTGVASNDVVDSPVRALDDRTPRYPVGLSDAGIAGSVRVRFVVDTLGRVEPSSIRVLDSSNQLFTQAVIAALRQSRFTAGAVSGRRVRTLVERSFRFDIAGGAHE